MRAKMKLLAFMALVILPMFLMALILCLTARDRHSEWAPLRTAACMMLCAMRMRARIARWPSPAARTSLIGGIAHGLEGRSAAGSRAKRLGWF